LLLRRGGRLSSCHRLFKARHLARHPGDGWLLLKNARRLLRPQLGGHSSDFLFVYVEKFYDDRAFIGDAARNCHELYLTPRGAVPFCVYNTCMRGITPPSL
jgi:hypothetical protein